MDKRAFIRQIVAKLDAEIARFAHAARISAADATDEQNRAENKYDTRGLEASYLAAGQGRQALETAQAREAFDTLDARDFAPDEAIAPGALVETRDAEGPQWYFLGPSAGGTEIELVGRTILVVTGQSPLGRQLLGKRAGETLPGGTCVVGVS